MNKITVIARYNEDVAWAEKLKTDIIVYNKGEHLACKFNVANIPNIGRETETYIRSILDFYHILDQYEYICFLQANPFDHSDQPVNIINNYDVDSICFIANAVVELKLPNINMFFGKNDFLIRKLFDENFKPSAIYTKDNITEESFLRGEEFLNTINFANLLNLDLNISRISYAAGAQYIVPVRFIKQKSYNWWFELFDLIHSWQQMLPAKDIGAHFERIWPLIFTHKS